MPQVINASKKRPGNANLSIGHRRVVPEYWPTMTSPTTAISNGNDAHDENDVGVDDHLPSVGIHNAECQKAPAATWPTVAIVASPSDDRDKGLDQLPKTSTIMVSSRITPTNDNGLPIRSTSRQRRSTGTTNPPGGSPSRRRKRRKHPSGSSCSTTPPMWKEIMDAGSSLTSSPASQALHDYFEKKADKQTEKDDQDDIYKDISPDIELSCLPNTNPAILLALTIYLKRDGRGK